MVCKPDPKGEEMPDFLFPDDSEVITRIRSGLVEVTFRIASQYEGKEPVTQMEWLCALMRAKNALGTFTSEGRIPKFDNKTTNAMTVTKVRGLLRKAGYFVGRLAYSPFERKQRNEINVLGTGRVERGRRKQNTEDMIERFIDSVR